MTLLQSADLTESIYSANWPIASPQVKQIMLMFMMRTQKPFKLTAKGYVIMNLNTFSAVSTLNLLVKCLSTLMTAMCCVCYVC